MKPQRVPGAARGALAAVPAGFGARTRGPDAGTAGGRPGGGPEPPPRRFPSPIRVLHLVSTLLPGGTELAMLRLIRAMPQGYRLRVAWLRGPAALEEEVRSATGAPPVPIGLRGKVDPGALLRLARLVRDEQFDLVHTHMDLADYYGALAARARRGVALVSTKENADEFRTRRTWKRPPFLLLEHLSYAAADAVIAVSEGLVEFLARAEGLPRHKTVVIRNGVDPEFGAEAPARTAARRLLGLPDEGPIVGTVGRLAEQKGQMDLLRALPVVLREQPGARVAIAGEGPLRPALLREAERLGIEGRVHLLGHVSDPRIAHAAFDLFALPSIWEGLPVALLEAMAMARPVVAARAVGVVETIDDGVEGLLVPPRDPAALGAALARLLRDRALAARLGEAGRTRVVERHSLEGVARSVDALYRDVLRRRR